MGLSNSNLPGWGAINIWYIGLPHFSYNVSIFALFIKIVDPALYNCLGVNKVGSLPLLVDRFLCIFLGLYSFDSWISSLVSTNLS
jgi:hypothetical protein